MALSVRHAPIVKFALLGLFGISLGLFIYGLARTGRADAPPHVAQTATRTPAQTVTQALPPYYFPNGGRQLFPQYRLVALYGSPGAPVLGQLGQQPLKESIDKIKATAKLYQALVSEPVLPTFEIIATVASGSPTDNKDYSREVDVSALQPWIDAAKAAGVYVILDLQPGRSDFLSQAKIYESLLKEPNVGLALDPEWRLGPNQVPLVQIGSVGIAEVNSVAGWLATLTRTNKLPQKVFLMHQFKLTMYDHREQLDTSHPELAYLIQMDGQGTQPVKLDTWHAIQAGAPQGVRFGWKDFTQKDSPMLSPEQTMQIVPQPWYVSYQ